VRAFSPTTWRARRQLSGSSPAATRAARLVEVAQRRHPEVAGRGLALLAALVVGAVDQAAAHPECTISTASSAGRGTGSVCSERQSMQQRVTGLAAGRDQLVHDAAGQPTNWFSARCASWAMRCWLSEPQVEQLLEGLTQRHLQRGRRGQARALGHVAADGQIGAGRAASRPAAASRTTPRT
jgi:hypothetical protein